METIHVFGSGIARGHILPTVVTTTPTTIDLVGKNSCYAGVEALTIKTDVDVFYSRGDETIETSGSGVLQGAILPSGTHTINWDNSKIKLASTSESATVEILAIHYDNIMEG